MILSQEHLNSIFEYKDGSLFYKKSCGTMKSGSKAGPSKPDGRIQVKVDGKLYLLHRIIFAMHNGYLPEMVDHIDGNNTNNRIENLRAATHEQNSWNAKARQDNVVGIKNISYNKKYGSWTVRVQANNIRKYIGSYKSLDEAKGIAMAYRNKYHKEFARHGNLMSPEEAKAFVKELP